MSNQYNRKNLTLTGETDQMYILRSRSAAL